VRIIQSNFATFAEIAFNGSVEKFYNARDLAMNKDLLEKDENDLLEMPGADEARFENIANPRFSGIDDEDDLLEIPQSNTGSPKMSETRETTSETINVESPDENITEESFTEESLTETTAVEEPFIQTSAEPESVAETARKSGLAYGAAITLFGSVIFLLALGLLADWLLGTSPWGIVLGVVLGAVIGFYQFFRITSQIFKK